MKIILAFTVFFILLTGQSSGDEAPRGYRIFCLLNPSHCQTGGVSTVTMTRTLLLTLNRVNKSVNKSIRPAPDLGDIWSINVSEGDCEDYVLTKRSKLIKLGVPAGSLRIATAFTRSGEGHAVLIVVSDAGNFILDNRTDKLIRQSESRLKWVAMSKSNSSQWVKL